MHNFEQSNMVTNEFTNASNGLYFEMDSASMLANNNYDDISLLAQSPFSSSFHNAFSPSPKSADIFLDNTLSSLFQSNSVKSRDYALTSQSSSLINPSSVGSIDSGNYSYNNNDALLTSFADESLAAGAMDIDESIFKSLEDTDCLFDLNIFGNNNHLNSAQGQFTALKTTTSNDDQTYSTYTSTYNNNNNSFPTTTNIDINNNNNLYTNTALSNNILNNYPAPCNNNNNNAINTFSSSNPSSISADSSRAISSPEDSLPSPLTPAKNPLADLPPPPKKPLSPYMRFSKGIWQQVKAANPGMTVCEVGTNIGRVWRELSEVDKQRFNNEFISDKMRYDSELQQYLQMTGLQASDLLKPKGRRKDGCRKEVVCRKRNADKMEGLNHMRDDVAVNCLLQQQQQQCGGVVGGLQQHQQAQQVFTTTDNAATSFVLQDQWNECKQDLYNNNNHSSGIVGNNNNNNVEKVEGLDSGSNQLVTSVTDNAALSRTVQHDEAEQQGFLSNINNNINFLTSNDNNNNNINLLTNNNNNLLTNNNNSNNIPWQQLLFSNNASDQNLLLNKLFHDNNKKRNFLNNNSNNISNLLQEQQQQQGNMLLQGLSKDGCRPREILGGIDLEKLLLRSALVEKSQEMLKLMRDLEQAYELIHQLKQQNDFYLQQWKLLQQQQQQQQNNNTTASQQQQNNSTAAPQQQQQQQLDEGSFNGNSFLLNNNNYNKHEDNATLNTLNNNNNNNNSNGDKDVLRQQLLRNMCNIHNNQQHNLHYNNNTDLLHPQQQPNKDYHREDALKSGSLAETKDLVLATASLNNAM